MEEFLRPKLEEMKGGTHGTTVVSKESAAACFRLYGDACAD